MRLDEYATFDAVGLAGLVRNGDVTPLELHELALAASDQVDSSINAVVETVPVDPDYVPAAGPLAGVPTMVKDLFHGQAGLGCGNGSRLSEGWQVSRQTQIYARALAAGLNSMGRTTTSEFGIMGTTETLACGITRSPVSTDHMAGGSSGGAGAVVGAGVVPIALASDGGGSIRIPASACGVVGLKPSRGRVPWGLRLKEPLIGWAVQFVTCRTIRDAALLLDVLGGPSPIDPEGLARPDVSYTDSFATPTGPLRIAVWTQPWSGHDPDPAVTQATNATAALLEAMGHHVEVDGPQFMWDRYLQSMTDVWASTNAHTIDGFAAAMGRPVDDTTVEGATLSMVEYGRTVTAQQLLDAMENEGYVTYVMREFFSRYDLLVTPTLAALPPTVGLYQPQVPEAARDTFDIWSRWETFLPIFNTTGNPAISLPLHVSEEGLPIGIQLVGGFGAEELLLKVSASLEQALPWAQRRPAVWVG